MTGEIASLNSVYRMLEDKESRHIFRNRVNWYMTGDNAFCEEIVQNYLPHLAPSMECQIANWLDTIRKDQKVVIWGFGRRAEQFFHLYDKHLGDRFLGFCDSNLEKCGKIYKGYPVFRPEELASLKPLSIAIMPAGNRASIIADILKVGFVAEDMYFSPYAGLEDRQNQYFEKDIVAYEDDEVFIDMGSLNLMTSVRLKELCPNLRKVYVMEPDEYNMNLCKANASLLEDTEVCLLPFGAWSKDMTLRFSGGQFCSSCICEDQGTSEIAVKAIDNLVNPNERITFMKADIEGAELEMLKGAANTIRRCKPKLAISIYHKPEDLTEIPLFVKELVPEYKLYIRVYGNDFTETVLYAIP